MVQHFLFYFGLIWPRLSVETAYRRFLGNKSAATGVWSVDPQWVWGRDSVKCASALVYFTNKEFIKDRLMN